MSMHPMPLGTLPLSLNEHVRCCLYSLNLEITRVDIEYTPCAGMESECMLACLQVTSYIVSSCIATMSQDCKCSNDIIYSTSCKLTQEPCEVSYNYSVVLASHMLVLLHLACRVVCSWKQIGLFATVDAVG